MLLLPQDRIRAIHSAAVECGLAADSATQDALLAGLSPDYVAELPAGGSPLVRLWNTLSVLNTTRRLLDGTLPLEIWLKNALLLRSKHLASRVFQEALDALAGGLPAPSPPRPAERRDAAPGPPSEPLLRFLFLGVQGGAGQAVLDPGEAYRTIAHEVALSGAKEAIALASGWAVRLPDVTRHLDEHRPHVVHFHAHGTAKGRLLLAWDGDRSMPVPPEPLAALLDEVRLVFFNACHSEALARAAVTSVDFAIGMAGVVEEKAAINLAAAFYQAIAAGRTVQKAFDRGVAMLGGLGLGEQDKPLLFSREGVDPKTAVLLPKK